MGDGPHLLELHQSVGVRAAPPATHPVRVDRRGVHGRSGKPGAHCRTLWRSCDGGTPAPDGRLCGGRWDGGSRCDRLAGKEPRDRRLREYRQWVVGLCTRRADHCARPCWDLHHKGWRCCHSVPSSTRCFTSEHPAQITANQLILHDDPNAEACFWLEKMHLHKTVYTTRQPQPTASRGDGAAASMDIDRPRSAGTASAASAAATARSAPMSHHAKASAYLAGCRKRTVTVADLEAVLPGVLPNIMAILVDNLIKDGKLFPVSSKSKSKSNGATGHAPEKKSYEVVMTACLSVVEASVRHGHDTVDAVHDKLKSHSRFANMQRKDVCAALDVLVERSSIYKVSHALESAVLNRALHGHDNELEETPRLRGAVESSDTICGAALCSEGDPSTCARLQVDRTRYAVV
eukprot:m.182964 g.182964  ORF g.182964 m.182964 type:complete len:405 (+) comp24653_c0_seq14:251-1465(+)